MCKKRFTRIFCLVLWGCLVGCTSLARLSKLPEENVPLNTFKPAPMAAVPPAQPLASPTDGSLWQAGGEMGSLFVDYKARSLGDIVTVEIVEDAQASNDAGTNTGKTSDMSAQIKSFLGRENKYGETDILNPFGKVAGVLENSFTGSGKTERSGKIKAEVTARVTEVMPNGNLRIEGVRVITINSERQFIVLAGIIRARDISSDNKIASTRIANASIVYSGTGVVDEQQRQGWLSRVINSVWPL